MNEREAFEAACELMPEGVTWGEPITPNIVKHIAALASQAQQTTELSDKCKVAASCLTYNDTEKEAVAKHLLLEASQELRRAQAQQSQWMPIETAPTGKEFLLAFYYRHRPHDVLRRVVTFIDKDIIALGWSEIPPAPEGTLTTNNEGN